MEGMYIKTKNPAYEQMTKFWVKIFALVFAVGVVSIVMSRTNWHYLPLRRRHLRQRARSGGHLRLLVGVPACSPSSFSAGTGWPLPRHDPRRGGLPSAHLDYRRKFQCKPAGCEMVGIGTINEGRRYPDPWAMVFNPSTVERLTHRRRRGNQALYLSSASPPTPERKEPQLREELARVAIPVALISSLLQPEFMGHLDTAMVTKRTPAGKTSRI